MPYYFDEDQPVAAARLGRSRGLDVMTTEECGRKGATDEQQLEFAAAQNRVLVTRNGRHFVQLTRRFQMEDRPHAGVLFVPPSIPGKDYASLIRAIEAFDGIYHGRLPAYAVVYLASVPR